MDDYSAKLTAEPFLYNETKIIAEHILNGEDAKELRKRNIEENLIQYKRQKSIARVNAPIFRRIAVLNDKLLDLFVHGDIDTSKYVLLYSIMKTDKIVKDFIFEVYKDKLFMRQEYIEKFDVTNWFEEKKILSKTLQNVTDNTFNKLRNVLMRIMQDSGLVLKEKERFKIIKPLLSDRFISLLDENGDIEYAKAIGGLR